MKYLLMTLLFMNSNALAQESCGSACSDVSRDKRDCVLKEECTPKVHRLNNEIVQLKKENKRLEAELAAKNDKTPVYIATEVQEKQEFDRNSFSLIAGASQTNLNVSSTASLFHANTEYKFDAGLMFQHDFDDFRGTIEATLNGSIFLGAGLRF